jgi:hypothetical protein
VAAYRVLKNVIGFERHLYKVVSALLGLLLIVALYQRALRVDPFDDAIDSDAEGSSGAAVQTAPELHVALLANPPTNETWARAMDNILREHSDVAVKSQRILELLPKLPTALQSEAAQHLVNFATDEKPDPVLRPLLEKSADASAQGVLLLGLLQRIDTVRLPALLQIARDDQHARGADALRYLAFIMEEDHGTYWAAWERAVERRLRESRL